MSIASKNEKYYRDLVIDFNRCLTDADLDAAFQRVKDYVFKNYPPQDAERKNREIINYQAAFSRVSKHRRIGEIGFAEYNQEVSKITGSIQDFVQTLKPDGLDIGNNDLLRPETIKSVWAYEDNIICTLVFQDGFSLLDSIFDRFKAYCQDKDIVRVDRYFFNGTRKVMLDEGHFNSLEDDELREVIIEPMNWTDAIIIQKKHKGFLSAEGFIVKDQESEEIIIRASGEDLYSRSSLMRDIIDWFKRVSYPESLKEPFYVKVHHSGLDVFYYFESE